MRVLLTGGSGFLGSHIAEQLSREGHIVRALVRKSSNRKFLQTLKGVEFAEGSVEDRASVDKAMEGVDAVIHSAGLVKARNEDEFYETNVKGTENLLEAAKTRGPALKRFVFVSSLAAIGPSPDGKPVASDRAPAPVTHYGRSKLAAERLVQAAKDSLPVTILRPAAIYGPRDVEIFAMFQAISRGVLPTIGLKESSISVVYGPDAADACVKALTAEVPSGSTYFVDDGKPQLLRGMLEGIEKSLGKKAFLRINLPMPVVYGAALASELYGRATKKAVMLTRDKMNEIRQPHWVCDSADARKDLNWSAQTPFDQGAYETARWYRANNWL